MGQDARRDQESATQRRARLLGLDYVDTSQLAQRPLFKDVLTLRELYDLRVVPLDHRKGYLLFGITTTTSQQTINGLKQRFTDERLNFALISDVGYKEYMKLYDPPKKVEYQDIAITRTDSPSVALGLRRM
jgi:hypothetical protein